MSVYELTMEGQAETRRTETRFQTEEGSGSRPSCPPLPDPRTCTDLDSFLDASNVRIQWLVEQGDCSLSSTEGEFRVGDLFSDGGVRLSDDDSDQSASEDGGVRAPPSFPTSRCSGKDDEMDLDGSDQAHPSPQPDSSPMDLDGSDQFYPWPQQGSSPMDIDSPDRAHPWPQPESSTEAETELDEGSSDEEPWTLVDHAVTTGSVFMQRLRLIFSGLLTTIPVISRPPSLTSEETLSPRSLPSDAGGSRPHVIQYLLELPNDSDEEPFFDGEPYIRDDDDDDDYYDETDSVG